jgi:hypothetical protein
MKIALGDSAPKHRIVPMPLFWKHHQSDVTRFLEVLKRERPNLEAEQRAGRSLLWDKTQDLDAQAQWQSANVRQLPYVYQTETQPAKKG